MILPLFDALRVQCHGPRQLLRFQWLDPANHDVRPALEHGRDLVLRHQATRALVDLDKLSPLSVQDELWMSGHWLPPIARQLRTVALVMRPEHLHNQMAAEALFWVTRHVVRLDVQAFEEAEAGLDWLTGGDAAAVAALQAEWQTAPPYQRPVRGRR